MWALMYKQSRKQQYCKLHSCKHLCKQIFLVYFNTQYYTCTQHDFHLFVKNYVSTLNSFPICFQLHCWSVQQPFRLEKHFVFACTNKRWTFPHVYSVNCVHAALLHTQHFLASTYGRQLARRVKIIPCRVKIFSLKLWECLAIINSKCTINNACNS